MFESPKSASGAIMYKVRLKKQEYVRFNYIIN